MNLYYCHKYADQHLKLWGRYTAIVSLTLML